MSNLTKNNIKVNIVDENTHYGFYAYRTNGRSMPKGFYTSYVAYQYQSVPELNSEYDRFHIEFSIQSPTGDSSDHHHWSFPCRSWEQAKSIVNNQYQAYEIMLDEYEEGAI